jgi:hypothetical protein
MVVTNSSFSGWVASLRGIVRASSEDRVEATAVQIVHKRGRVVLGIDPIGSAHDDGQLAILLETARAQLNAGQQMLPIDNHGATGGRPIGELVVEGTASLIVWETLAAVYAPLGFDQISGWKGVCRSEGVQWPSGIDLSYTGGTT